MNFLFNFSESDAYIDNIAYIKALFIKDTIECLNIPLIEKERLKKEVLDYLKSSKNDLV